mmetsp:Transcript_43939/g.124123  ORF Transcript_43939/g.124123 Transcript_43939/m.124123 type:complete len:226 (+) Transcript_43939:169-846(+)
MLSSSVGALFGREWPQRRQEHRGVRDLDVVGLGANNRGERDFAPRGQRVYDSLPGEAKDTLVWVGPGKGNYALEDPADKAAVAQDDCINPPELIANGEPFFRRGVVAKAVYLSGVTCILGLLVLGLVCLTISFVFPSAIAVPCRGDTAPASTTPLPWPGRGEEDSSSRSPPAKDRSLCEGAAAEAQRRSLAGSEAPPDGGRRTSAHLEWCCRRVGIGCASTPPPG